MTALVLTILANIVLFLAAGALSFYMLGTIGNKLIGFREGAYAAVFTDADRKSLWRYRWLSLGVMGTSTKGSGLLMLLMPWSILVHFRSRPDDRRRDWSARLLRAHIKQSQASSRQVVQFRLHCKVVQLRLHHPV